LSVNQLLTNDFLIDSLFVERVDRKQTRSNEELKKFVAFCILTA